MFDEHFINKLRCPDRGGKLRLLDSSGLDAVNRAIQSRTIVNRVGDRVTRPLSDGFVNEDHSLVYPVWDDIPTLIPEEALPWEQFEELEKHG